MKRVMSIFLALAILTIFTTIFTIGCSGIDQQTKIKCPKCGAVFTVDEGLNEIRKKGF